MKEKIREYTFRNGTTVKVRRISPFMVNRLRVNRVREIEVPQVVRKYGTRQEEKLVYDYDNVTYKELIEEQRELDLADTLGNLSSFAVVDEVPNSEIAFYTEIANSVRGENYTDQFVKELWIFDQIEDAEELDDFQKFIFGQANITQEGVEESEKKFPDIDKQQVNLEV